MADVSAATCEVLFEEPLGRYVLREVRSEEVKVLDAGVWRLAQTEAGDAYMLPVAKRRFGAKSCWTSLCCNILQNRKIGFACPTKGHELERVSLQASPHRGPVEIRGLFDRDVTALFPFEAECRRLQTAVVTHSSSSFSAGQRGEDDSVALAA